MKCQKGLNAAQLRWKHCLVWRMLVANPHHLKHLRCYTAWRMAFWAPWPFWCVSREFWQLIFHGAKKTSDKTWYICLIEFDICCDFVVRSGAYEHANKNIWQRNKSMKPRWPTRTSLEAMNCPGSMSRNAWFTVTNFFGYRSFCWIWGYFWLSQGPLWPIVLISPQFSKNKTGMSWFGFPRFFC